MDKLLTLLWRHKVSFSFFPISLEVLQRWHQILVIFQLRIHSLNVFFVLPEQLPQSLEALSDSLGQFPHSLWLTAGNPPADSFSLEQDLRLQVISSLSIWIGHSVDFIYDLDQLLSVLIVIRALDHDFAFRSFSDLGRSYLFFNINSFLNKSSGVLLDQHKFNDVELLVLNPIFVKLLEDWSYFVD